MPIIRKWGDSLAVAIPPAEIKEKKLKEGDEVEIRVYKNLDSKVFGILPKKYRKNVSGHEAKTILREEW